MQHECMAKLCERNYLKFQRYLLCTRYGVMLSDELTCDRLTNVMCIYL